MDITFVTTEAVPFAKTGGLADVCGTLPQCLADRGHTVNVIMPAFRQVFECGQQIESTGIEFSVNLRGSEMHGNVLQSQLPIAQAESSAASAGGRGRRPRVPVYLIEQPDFFDRPSLYGDAHGDYQDNASRFIFFCRAVLQVISRVAGSVDIVQCNDWQSGLIPAYCRLRYDDHSWMHHAKTVMTVHNLAYQGNFWQHDYSLTDLDYQHFRPAELEFYGHLNLLKAGIMMADVVTTVSPRYAEEIQTDQHGCGLQGVLRHRSDRLAGIINGIDPLVWDPMSDAYLETPYNVQNWQSGKRDARRQLFREMNTEWQLDDDKQRPTLIGLVGRFAYQKGWDLVLEAMQMLIDDDDPLRFIVLGSGDADYERQLRQIAEERPDRLALHVGFSDRLAHLIESASDAFAMPSRYEPCGLNQLYSLRYGTVPIVNPTGGLADTVVDSSAETLSSRQATGFYLRDYSGTGLANSIRSASAVRREEPENWSQIVETGMKQDWTWRRSAVRYEQLYANTLALAKES